MKKNKALFANQLIGLSRIYSIFYLTSKRRTPHELALLPMVESGFQPFAYSASRAAGIWQFIPPTAREWSEDELAI